MIPIISAPAYEDNSIEDFGRYLLHTYRRDSTSFEKVSQATVTEIYHHFKHDSAASDFALLRIFRVSHFGDLLPELQKITHKNHPNYLALMGTIGDESTWCQRQTSQKRQVIPLDANMSPMFKGVFSSLGFSWKDDAHLDKPEGNIASSPVNQYFYVPMASQSSYITDQETFVETYQIQSVVAFGSRFLSGAAYVLIGFSKRYMEKQQAKAFAILASYVGTTLANYDNQHQIWDPSPEL